MLGTVDKIILFFQKSSLIFAFFCLLWCLSSERAPQIKRPDAITVGILADAKRLIPIFTADDVIFAYYTVSDPKTPVPYTSNFGPVEKVQKIDKYTVRVIYSEPFAPALESREMDNT